MKKPNLKHCMSIGLALLTISSFVLASGKHAGGHAHDDTAIGKPGVAAQAQRTITVDMADTMRFTPDSLKVQQGETIRFIVKNSGKLTHELVFGTAKELQEHYEQMKKFPEMEHDDPNMITLAPGKAGEVVWQFTQAGKVDFACLQPGHYEAGMKGFVNVMGVKMPSKTPAHEGHKH